MTMPAKEAAKVLRVFNAWRTDKNVPASVRCPSVRDITVAIDAAVAALEAVAEQSPPATDSHQPAADSRHPRETALAQDAARGSFRRNNDADTDGA